jgi:hypothetical protein
VWLDPLLGALLTGRAPERLESSTTHGHRRARPRRHHFSTFLAAVLLLRRRPSGYLAAFPLVVLLVILVPVIAAQTVSQLAAGVSLAPGEIIGPLAGFLVLGVIALGFAVSVLRRAGAEAAR